MSDELDYDPDRRLYLPRRGFISLAVAALAGTVVGGWSAASLSGVDLADPRFNSVTIYNYWSGDKHWWKVGEHGEWRRGDAPYQHGMSPIVLLGGSR